MISVVNGYDVDARQAVRDKWDLTEFLKKNKVKVVDGFKGKKEITVNNFNDGKFAESESRQKRNRDQAIDASIRRRKQIEVLSKYIEHSNVRGRWVNLVKLSGSKLSSSHLSRASVGETTIARKEEWLKIENTVNEIVSKANEKN